MLTARNFSWWSLSACVCGVSMGALCTVCKSTMRNSNENLKQWSVCLNDNHIVAISSWNRWWCAFGVQFIDSQTQRDVPVLATRFQTYWNSSNRISATCGHIDIILFCNSIRVRCSFAGTFALNFENVFVWRWNASIRIIASLPIIAMQKLFPNNFVIYYFIIIPIYCVAFAAKHEFWERLRKKILQVSGGLPQIDLQVPMPKLTQYTRMHVEWKFIVWFSTHRIQRTHTFLALSMSVEAEFVVCGSFFVIKQWRGVHSTLNACFGKIFRHVAFAVYGTVLTER